MSEYREIFERKYKKDNMDYSDEMEYLFMLNAPKQYGVEDEMLEYLKRHPDVSVAEVFNYFDEIAPEGLPIGDDGSDLLEEE